jgi:hypothetical protein
MAAVHSGALAARALLEEVVTTQLQLEITTTIIIITVTLFSIIYVAIT